MIYHVVRTEVNKPEFDFSLVEVVLFLMFTGYAGTRSFKFLMYPCFCLSLNRLCLVGLLTVIHYNCTGILGEEKCSITL